MENTPFSKDEHPVQFLRTVSKILEERFIVRVRDKLSAIVVGSLKANFFSTKSICVEIILIPNSVTP